EQQPTLCALGVLVADTVISSAGILIQPLPGCSEETLHALEVRTSLFSDISVMLQRYTLEGILDAAFQGLTPQILATNPLRYQCDCTRERMERVLISMGRDEL
ncbi:MAG: Hsp33 family molecular chaperone HslO, partial [Clostridia bacterium]